MAADVGKNILYGGPEPPIIDDESESFGEVILKKLATHGNNVMFVSTQSFSNCIVVFQIFILKKIIQI